MESENKLKRNSSSGHRIFFKLPSQPELNAEDVPRREIQHDSPSGIRPPLFKLSDSSLDEESMLEVPLCTYINDNIIGKNKVFKGPFGDRRVVYCDYTASGRSLSFIEDYIRDEVLPHYGNTHTTTTVTSLQTTLFRHEARDIVRNAVRASDHDAVIFVGSGCTGAIHKLVHNLRLDGGPAPVVLVGPFEHHSNLLPWRHVAHKVVRIRATSDGSLDVEHLEETLKTEVEEAKTSDRQLIGCFSAASNVTGILTDTNIVSAMLHRYNALAFWDYACSAPYVTIDMNPVVTGPDQAFVYKDAVFFSLHKFVGGVQTPGLLVAKKKLFRAGESYPNGAGGGSVFFVRRDNELYLQDVEMREEGGTPAIVESVRGGLVMQLKQAVGSDVIMAREEEYVKLAWNRFSHCPNLIVLGGSSAPRLPIFSFMIRCPSEAGPGPRFLHHNYVCVLLNDLFGVQARGGCACAGPYALDLLGIDETLATQLEELLVGSGLDQFVLSKYFEYPHREVLRPGFTRLNLPFFMPLQEVNYVLSALDWVATNGWRLLPLYKFNPETGEWRHRQHDPIKERQWLGFVSYTSGKMTWRRPRTQSKGTLPRSFEDLLTSADEILEESKRSMPTLPSEEEGFDAVARQLRWFVLPSEVVACLNKVTSGGAPTNSANVPFTTGTIASCFESGKNVHLESSCPPCRLATALENGFKDTVQTSDVDKDTKGICVCQENNYDVVTPTVADIKKTVPDIPEKSKAPRSKSSRTNADKTTLVGHSSQKVPQPMLSSGDSGPSEREKHALWKPPCKEIYKAFLQATEEFNMIQNGDRVMVCLSGGKDSLSLLHTLGQYRHQARAKGVHFELGACTVDPGTSSYDPSPLIPYLEKLGVPYFYERQGIIDQAANLPYEVNSICSFCSRMKRGRLYAAARREGFNVLALGQHLDDLVESFLMSVFHNGCLRTMKANYVVEEGDLRIIRPLVYVREKLTREFADRMALPVIPENCPACYEAPKERFRVKQLLAEQEIIYPRLYSSLQASMKPLLAISRTGVRAEHLDWTEEKVVEEERNGDVCGPTV